MKKKSCKFAAVNYYIVMNNIETRPIGQLIRNENTPQRPMRVEHFLIPSYQRGYRWTELHVKALLEDIDDFLKSQAVAGAIRASYCLQPIVVVARQDDEGKQLWEIVDGQQRLTTLFIILKRLGKPCFQLFFEKRPDSNKFLSDLSSSTLNHDTPDFHFMSEAWCCIDKWFKEKEDRDIAYADDFATTLLKLVQVIWYEVQLKTTTPIEQESEKIDIFNRLNIGKIPLEDAELVRALLMSKVEGDSEHEKLMRQAEFSNEWYEIEHWLQQPEQWRFLTGKNYANHIQLIFELQAHNKNSENYNTYKWFEQELRNSPDAQNRAFELWKQTKEIFSRFRYWFSHRTIYHYAGFLLVSGELKLNDLLSLSEMDKKAFKKDLKDKIIEYIESINIDLLSYENNQNEAKRYLLLFNVLSVLQLKANPQNRFPFNLYREIENNERWSLEHIHAQKSQDPLKTDKIIREWISDTLDSISKINTINKVVDDDTVIINITPLKEELMEMSKRKEIDKDSFNDLRERIVEAFDSRGTMHALENMALLSCPDNSRLNNAIFPVKRDRIIEMERQGRFIPPCTRNVFLKLYSKADNQPYFWSTSDKSDYIAEINRVFDHFKKASEEI